MQRDIIEQQCADCPGALNANGQTGNTLKIRANRCQIDVPSVPLRHTQVGRRTVVVDLQAVDLDVQLSGRIGRIAKEPQGQYRSPVACPVLRRSKGARDLRDARCGVAVNPRSGRSL